jgi:selenide,water dikinase
MGIDRVDHLLMILAISSAMSDLEKDVVTRELMKGFNDCAEEAGAPVTGGQSIYNPWPIIGGVANVVCHENEYLSVNNGEHGDILVLTKPIGT